MAFDTKYLKYNGILSTGDTFVYSYVHPTDPVKKAGNALADTDIASGNYWTNSTEINQPGQVSFVMARGEKATGTDAYAAYLMILGNDAGPGTAPTVKTATGVTIVAATDLNS